MIQKAAGTVCLSLICGCVRRRDMANSIGSRFTRAFTGEPMGKAVNYYIAGVAVGLFGVPLIF